MTLNNVGCSFVRQYLSIGVNICFNILLIDILTIFCAMYKIRVAIY